MIEIRKQDLMLVDADAICHQVNCCGAMGAGIAKAIVEKYPEVRQKYHDLCSKAKANGTQRDLLGSIQAVPVEDGRDVVNVFGQLYYSRNNIFRDYDALAKAFTEIDVAYAGKKVAFPYGFGCGLAGGDWTLVEKLMLKYLQKCDVIICFKEEFG